MVKLEIVFDATETKVKEIKLLDKTNLGVWDILLLPIKETLQLNLSWLEASLQSYVENVQDCHFDWFQNLVPSLHVEPNPLSTNVPVSLKESIRERLQLDDHQSISFILDIYKSKWRHIKTDKPSTTKLCLEMVAERVKRYFYHEYRQRLILKIQKENQQTMRLQIEIMDSMIARMMAAQDGNKKSPIVVDERGGVQERPHPMVGLPSQSFPTLPPLSSPTPPVPIERVGSPTVRRPTTYRLLDEKRSPPSPPPYSNSTKTTKKSSVVIEDVTDKEEDPKLKQIVHSYLDSYYAGPS